MIYFIDGYNLIFSLSDSSLPLKKQRDEWILALQEKFAEKNLKGHIVFDGKERGHAYPSPLQVDFAPHGQSADSYIIEQLELLKNPKEAIVVTNDRGLIRRASSLGAHHKSTKSFIQFLLKAEPERRPAPKETKYHFERLLRIFTENSD